MTYSALDVAKYILNYCSEKGRPASNLKLQKIIYFLWVDYYKETGEELFCDEICAWQLGPVVPNVYYEFCSYAGIPISTPLVSNILDCDKAILSRILDKYISTAASTLVNRTHRPGTPWSIIYQEGNGIRDVIPFSLIKRLECEG